MSVRSYAPLLLVFLALSANAQRLNPPDLSTDTRSEAFATAEERLAFLKRYLNFQSVPRDAQYHIVYFDNSQGRIPGPSDWDIRVVLRLEPGDVSLWLADLTEVKASGDFGWALKLGPDLEEEVLAEAHYFRGPGKRAALLEEDTLALWYSTLP